MGPFVLTFGIILLLSFILGVHSDQGQYQPLLSEENEVEGKQDLASSSKVKWSSGSNTIFRPARSGQPYERHVQQEEMPVISSPDIAIPIKKVRKRARWPYEVVPIPSEPLKSRSSYYGYYDGLYDDPGPHETATYPYKGRVIIKSKKTQDYEPEAEENSIRGRYSSGQGGGYECYLPLLASLFLLYYSHFYNNGTTGPPGPPGPPGPTGKRRKRDIHPNIKLKDLDAKIEDLTTKVLPDLSLKTPHKLSNLDTPRDKAGLLLKRLSKHFNIISQAERGHVPVHCALKEICIANHIIVSELGSFGRPIGYILTTGISKILGKGVSEDPENGPIFLAGQTGRRAQGCSKLAIDGCDNLETNLTRIDPERLLSKGQIGLGDLKREFNLL